MTTRTIDLKEVFPEALADAPATQLVEYAPGLSPEIKDFARPAMIVFPGGGYCHLSDRENEPVALEYLAKGFHVFVLRYALNPAHYPVQLLQSAAAVRYIRSNARELRVDPAKISVVGFSAGGHCAAMIATMSDEREILKAFGAKQGELTPDAAVLCYAVLVDRVGHETSFDVISGGDAAVRKYLSLDQRVTAHTPPCFLFHTFADGAVDIRNSLIFAGALKEKGVSAELFIPEDGPHGLSVADRRVMPGNYESYDFPKAVPWLDRSVDFLKAHGLWLD